MFKTLWAAILKLLSLNDAEEPTSVFRGDDSPLKESRKPRDNSKITDEQVEYIVELFLGAEDTQENLTKVLNAEFGYTKSRSAYAHVYQAQRRK